MKRTRQKFEEEHASVQMMKPLGMALLLALPACSTGAESQLDSELSSVAAELSVADALSFDNPSDWSVSGGSVAASSMSTEGSGSVQLTTTYYAELAASGLESPAGAGDSFSFDVQSNVQHSWGTLQVIATIPSQQVYWVTVGSVSLSSLTPGQFNHIELPLPAQVEQAMGGTFSDLELRFTVSGVPSQVWLDNGSFGGAAGPSCSDGIQNGDETGVDCGGSCLSCSGCGDGTCDGSESCSSCPGDCGPCGEGHCSDGVLNGNELAVDCGGACAPCGAAASGILFYDKFTHGMNQWTTGAFTSAPLVNDLDYAESGSGAPAATASGATKLTSPVVNLSAAQGVPLLRFQRLIDAPPGSETWLEVFQNDDWHPVRDLAAQGGNDGRWRTEFVPLEDFANASHVQFRFATSGSETTFQVDDVAIEDRRAVDREYFDQTFVMANTYEWKWRTSPSDEWSDPTPGPFSDDNGRWPASADLYLETELDILNEETLNGLRFWARWDDQLEVRVNGTLVLDEDDWSPSLQYLEPLANPWFVGKNLITVHAHDGAGARIVDLALTQDTWPTPPETVDPPELASGGSSPLAGFADRIRDYAETRAVPSVAFSLFKNGTRIVDAAYGYSDADRSEPLALNPVMRLASVDKSYVVAAAAQLIANNHRLADGRLLKRETRVFPTLRNHYEFDAEASQAGEWIDSVTVGHLMDHTSNVVELPEGGVDDFYDVVGNSRGHTTRHDNALYIHQTDCTAEPGTSSVEFPYSNSGYMLLRYFIDVITDEGFAAYLQNEVQDGVFLDHESLLGRDPTEPGYAILSSPYDRWINFEHYLGLAATPRSVAELAQNYHLQEGHAVVAGGVAPGEPCVLRNGGMLGTTAWALQCERGISFALLYNGPEHGGSFDDLVGIVQSYALSLSDADYGE